MRPNRRVVLSGAALLCLVGLALAAAQTQPQQPAASAGMGQHMDQHFGRVVEIQEAVIRGDIEAAREDARWMAGHEEPGVPPSARSHVDEMKRAARAVADATDVAAAATGTAQMAAACGDCHAATKARVQTPAFPPVTGTAGKGELSQHMSAHQHATDLLYQGLIVPSGEAWAKGADLLKGSPLAVEKLPADPKLTSEVKKAEADTHALAGRAAAASDQKARTGVYGDLIGTCAQCHSLHGQVWGPGVPKK
jgi:cytochrome c553